MEIPPGYSSVGVEHICDSQYEGLELDLPRGDGEIIIGDAFHGIILWCKGFIIIPGKEASLLPIDPLQLPFSQKLKTVISSTSTSRTIVTTETVASCSITVSSTIES